MCVLVSHYADWTAVSPADYTRFAWPAMAFLGMPIFFTLSGFVIAYSYGHWDWRERPVSNLLRLFLYRFARLYPAFLVFAVLIVIRWPEARILSNPGAHAYLLPNLFLLHTWLPLKFEGVPAADGQFHVSWSLSTECALYLWFGLGAILAAALPSWRFKKICLAATFFVTAGLLSQLVVEFRSSLASANWSEQEWRRWFFYHSPYMISLQFGLGVVACQIFREVDLDRWKGVASNLGAAAFIVIYLLVGAYALKDGEYAIPLLTALATALVLIGASTNTLANRVLSGRAIVYVGMISYSLYLFHFLTPRMASFALSFDSFTWSAAGFQAVSILATSALAIFLATGIYQLVEVPGRRALRAAADRWLARWGLTATRQEKVAPAS